MRGTRRYPLIGALALLVTTFPTNTAGATTIAAVTGASPTSAGAPPESPPVDWCAKGFKDPYKTPPAGGFVVPAGNNRNEPFMHSWTVKPNRTYWFAPGTHTFGTSQYASIDVAHGDVFVGAPGAILSGQGKNNYAFTSTATGNPLTSLERATIEYLTITDFVAGPGEMVVGQGGYDGWTIEHNDITGNPFGAGVALGSNAKVVDNCLAHNGEYGYSSLGGATNVVFSYNDVYDNNYAGYYDIPGSKVQCGCSGGGKFWMTTDAVVTHNYVHSNIGTGIWVDTDNAGFDISSNYISENWSQGITYEISYNGQITDNTLIGNNYGDVTSNDSPSFPAAAIYISESGDSVAVHSTYNQGVFLLAGNVLTNNWGGIVLFQDGDRVCGFSADGTCTMPHNAVYTLSSCKSHLEGMSRSKAIREQPDYYDNCRWKTQYVTVAHNTINFDPSKLTTGAFAGSQTCAEANAEDNTLCGYSGLFSTYSSVKPYMGPTGPLAVSDQQHNVFEHNTYHGPIRFVAFVQSDRVSWSRWSRGFVDGYSGDTFKPQDHSSSYS